MAAALASLATALPAAATQAQTQATAPDVFRIGMIAQDRDAPAVEGLPAIRAAFSNALSMPVEVFVARDYAALIDAQARGRLDYAIYSVSAYAVATARCGCIRPVAAPVDANGAMGMRSILIARTGIEAKTIAIGPPDSLTGRLSPLASWPQAREAASEGRLVEAQSASAAEAMFIAGEVDGFFGWIPAWPDDALDVENAGERAGGSPARLRKAGVAGSEIEIRWRSHALRYGPHAVRADMPATRVESLARLLTGATSDNPDLLFYLGRRQGGTFEEADDDDYAEAVAALAALKNMDE